MTMKAGSCCELFARDSELERIFAERDQRSDLRRTQRRRRCAQSFAPGSIRQARAVCAPFVFGLRSSLSRMSSPGPVRGTMSISVDAEQFREPRGEPEFFVRHPAGGDDRDLPAGKLFQLRRGMRRSRCSQDAAAACRSDKHLRFEQTFVAIAR